MENVSRQRRRSTEYPPFYRSNHSGSPRCGAAIFPVGRLDVGQPILPGALRGGSHGSLLDWSQDRRHSWGLRPPPSGPYGQRLSGLRGRWTSLASWAFPVSALCLPLLLFRFLLTVRVVCLEILSPHVGPMPPYARTRIMPLTSLFNFERRRAPLFCSRLCRAWKWPVSTHNDAPMFVKGYLRDFSERRC